MLEESTKKKHASLLQKACGSDGENEMYLYKKLYPFDWEIVEKTKNGDQLRKESSECVCPVCKKNGYETEFSVVYFKPGSIDGFFTRYWEHNEDTRKESPVVKCNTCDVCVRTFMRSREYHVLNLISEIYYIGGSVPHFTDQLNSFTIGKLSEWFSKIGLDEAYVKYAADDFNPKRAPTVTPFKRSRVFGRYMDSLSNIIPDITISTGLKAAVTNRDTKDLIDGGKSRVCKCCKVAKCNTNEYYRDRYKKNGTVKILVGLQDVCSVCEMVNRERKKDNLLVAARYILGKLKEIAKKHPPECRYDLEDVITVLKTNRDEMDVISGRYKKLTPVFNDNINPNPYDVRMSYLQHDLDKKYIPMVMYRHKAAHPVLLIRDITCYNSTHHNDFGVYAYTVENTITGEIKTYKHITDLEDKLGISRRTIRRRMHGAGTGYFRIDINKQPHIVKHI